MQYAANSTEVNSPPRSVLSTRIFLPLSASTRALNFLTASTASVLLVRSYSHMNRLQSSTSRLKYLHSPCIVGVISP